MGQSSSKSSACSCIFKLINRLYKLDSLSVSRSRSADRLPSLLSNESSCAVNRMVQSMLALQVVGSMFHRVDFLWGRRTCTGVWGIRLLTGAERLAGATTSTHGVATSRPPPSLACYLIYASATSARSLARKCPATAQPSKYDHS